MFLVWIKGHTCVISLCLCDVLMFSSLNERLWRLVSVIIMMVKQQLLLRCAPAQQLTQSFRSWTADLQPSAACAVHQTISSSAQGPLLTDSWTQTEIRLFSMCPLKTTAMVSEVWSLYSYTIAFSKVIL